MRFQCFLLGSLACLQLAELGICTWVFQVHQKTVQDLFRSWVHFQRIPRDHWNKPEKNKCRNLATKTQRTQRLLGQKVRGLTVQSATNQEPSCIQSFLLPNPPSWELRSAIARLASTPLPLFEATSAHHQPWWNTHGTKLWNQRPLHRQNPRPAPALVHHQVLREQHRGSCYNSGSDTLPNQIESIELNDGGNVNPACRTWPHPPDIGKALTNYIIFFKNWTAQYLQSFESFKAFERRQRIDNFKSSTCREFCPCMVFNFVKLIYVYLWFIANVRGTSFEPANIKQKCSTKN